MRLRKKVVLLALYYSGEALRRLTNFQSAIDWFEQCCEEAGDNGRYVVRALERWAHTLLKMGHIELAKGKLQEAKQLAETLDDVFCQALVIHEQGNLAWFQEHLDEAIGFYQRALMMYVGLKDLGSQLTVWLDIGLTHHYIGRIDKAIAGYQEAIKLARYLDHPSLGLLLSNLGECYQDLFAMEQARAYHEQAVTAVRSLPMETDNLPSTLADIHRNLGVDLYYLGEVEKGQEQLQIALSLLVEEDDFDVRLQTWLYRGFGGFGARTI